MLRRCHVAVACGVIAVVAASPAAAQTDLDRAKEHYRQAEVAAQKGDHSTAAAQYQRAYEFSKDPVLFYKIGNAHEKAGDCTAAIGFYEKYLAEGQPDEQFRTLTGQRIAACKTALAAEPGDAGQKPGPGDPAAGDPAAGDPAAGDPAAGVTDPAGAGAGDPTGPGDAATAGGDLAVADDPAAGETPPSFVDQKPSWQRSAAWVSVGVSLALLSTGGVLGLSASSREEDIQNLIDFRNPATTAPAAYSGNTRQRYEELVDEGEQLSLYSVIAFGAAGAAAAAAVTFFIIDPGPSGADAGAGAQVRVVPVAAPDRVGVSAGWQF